MVNVKTGLNDSVFIQPRLTDINVEAAFRAKNHWPRRYDVLDSVYAGSREGGIDYHCRVGSFEFVVLRGDSVMLSLYNTGPVFTAANQVLLSRKYGSLKSGDVIYIKNVRVTDPWGHELVMERKYTVW